MNGEKDKNIQRAVDSIEPDKTAESRMYENILKKAEGKRRNTKILRMVKPAASAAACVCLVIAAALLLKDRVNNSADFSGEMGVNLSADMNGAVNDPEVDNAYLEHSPDATHVAEYDHAEAEIGMYGTYTETVTAFPYPDAEGANMITTGFGMGLDIYEGASLTTVVPGDIAMEGENGYASESFDFSAESENISEGFFGESENLSADSSESEETVETIPFNFPGGASRIVYTDASNDFISADFVFKGHSYTINVSFYETVENKDDVDYEDIGNLSDSNAVMYLEEYNGIMCYRVRWSNAEYHFAMLNNDGASRGEIIEVSTNAIVNNR